MSEKTHVAIHNVTADVVGRGTYEELEAERRRLRTVYRPEGDYSHGLPDNFRVVRAREVPSCPR